MPCRGQEASAKADEKKKGREPYASDKASCLGRWLMRWVRFEEDGLHNSQNDQERSSEDGQNYTEQLPDLEKEL